MRAIEAAVRHLVGQVHMEDQLEAMAAVRRAWESERFLGNDPGAASPALRRWVVWLVDDELRRRVGTWGFDDVQSGRVFSLNSRMPRLLNAAQITTPGDWVEVFLMPSNPGPAAQPSRFNVYAEGSDGLQTAGNVVQFEHIRFDGDKLRKVMQSGDSYDPTIRFLYDVKPLAATLTLLQSLRTEADADAAAVPGAVATADAKFREARTRAIATYGAPAPPDMRPKLGRYADEVRAALFDLAAIPQWPVHLYVLERLERYEELRDPEVIERMLSHGDLVTERFVAHHKTQLKQRRQASGEN